MQKTVIQAILAVQVLIQIVATSPAVAQIAMAAQIVIIVALAPALKIFAKIVQVVVKTLVKVLVINLAIAHVEVMKVAKAIVHYVVLPL